VRNKVAAVAVAGLVAAAGAYGAERWLNDDAAEAAVSAALDAFVVIVVGIMITAALDHRAAERRGALERRRRAAVRSQLLDRLGPNLNLAASGWVHRPGLSAPGDEDLSAEAGRDAIGTAAEALESIEQRLKQIAREPALG
jgi:hypothetical protein